MKYLKKNEAPPDIEVAGENTLSDQGKEVLSFIVKLIEPIQVAVRDNPKQPDKLSNRIVNFMRPSGAFFLSDKSKDSFMGRLDLENSRQDIINEMTLFQIEMDANKDFCQKFVIWYNITKNGSMVTMKITSWLIALILNLIILFTYKLNEAVDDESKSSRKLGEVKFQKWVNLASYIYAGLNFFVFLIWLYPAKKISYAVQKEMYMINN